MLFKTYTGVYLTWAVVLSSIARSTFGDTSSLEIHHNGEGSTEFCLAYEAFIGKCLKNEVILVNSALYGRMRIGRCLMKESHKLHEQFGSDPLFLGCSVDVLGVFDAKCSGKSQCEVQYTEPDIQKEQPCHHGLTSYLEAEYECLTVIEDDRSCVVQVSSNPLHIMRSSSSSSTSKLSCGTKSQPWRLEAPAGQQINVSLLESGPKKMKASKGRQSDKNTCGQQYGYVFDTPVKKNISVCGDVEKRKSFVYKSSSNFVQLVLNSDSDNSNVFIRFNAVGCSNLVPPEDTWLRRDEAVTVVGCYSSRQTWHLRCVDNQWIGVVGNCTREDVQNSDAGAVGPVKLKSSTHDYQVMIIVAIACIGVAVCLIVIGCGAVLYRRYSRSAKQYHHKVEESNGGRFLETTAQREKHNTQQCTPLPQHL